MKYALLLGSLMMLGAGCTTSPTIEQPLPTSTNATSTDTLSTPTSTEPTATSTSVKTTPPSPTPQPTTPRTVAPSKPSLQPSTPPVTKPGPQTLYVNITDEAFAPQVMAVNAGDTVVWVNKGTTGHTTESDGSLLWSSGNIPLGHSYRRVFKYVGSYKYHDGANPQKIRGTIVVH